MERAHRCVARTSIVVVLALAVFCTHPLTASAQTDAGASALRDDLKARRARLLDKLGSGTMAILWSAPERVYSRDVDYEYRQDSDLLYLTGVEQPDTILVLVPGSRSRKEFLFVRPPNPRREHFVGRFLSAEEARARTGIESIFLTTEFEAFLASMFNRRPYGLTVDQARDSDDDHYGFFRALDEGTARLALRFEGPAAFNAPLSDEYIFANRARERLIGVSIVNVAPALHALRQVKTPYEQKVLTESVDISSEAHLAGMRA